MVSFNAIQTCCCVINRSSDGHDVFFIVCLFSLLGGFYTRSLPFWLDWIKYVSFLQYTFSAMLYLEFNDGPNIRLVWKVVVSLFMNKFWITCSHYFNKGQVCNYAASNMKWSFWSVIQLFYDWNKLSSCIGLTFAVLSQCEIFSNRTLKTWQPIDQPFKKAVLVESVVFWMS